MNETLDCLSRSEAEKAIAEWQIRQEYGPERSLVVTFPDEAGQIRAYAATSKPGQPNGSFEKIRTYGEMNREPVPPLNAMGTKLSQR